MPIKKKWVGYKNQRNDSLIKCLLEKGALFLNAGRVPKTLQKALMVAIEKFVLVTRRDIEFDEEEA